MLDDKVNAVAELARKAAVQLLKGADGREYVAHAGSVEVIELPGCFQPAPQRIRQSVSIHAKDSFTDYVIAYAGARTRIFADINFGKFVAILDYHWANEDEPDDECRAQHLDHRVTFTLQESEEWKRWRSISGKMFPQEDFVRFLEENAADIAEPSGADLLEICRDFRAHRNVKFAKALRLQSGEESFEYIEEIRGVAKSGSINVPNMFQLRIPVYFGEPAAEVRAFLRFRLDPFTLGIELHRPEPIKQAVFQAIGRDIAEKTERPLHYGAI
jgi:uncharacterized protein YfdQ (DUF2303 family)